MTSGFARDNTESIVNACRDRSTVIGRAFRTFAETDHEISIGSLTDYMPDVIEGSISGAGLVILFQVGEEGAAVLIPETLLPSHHLLPEDASTVSAVEALADQWSRDMMPRELETNQSTGLLVNNIEAEISAAKPLPWAQCLELIVETPQTETGPVSDDQAANGRMHLVWPLGNPPFPVELSATSPERSAEEMAADRARVIKNLSQIPIPVVVRLAEKKMDVGQVMDLSPGLLITFSKPCDDLLDLYVNNHLYCRGEAVKIGEKFGLKINDVDIELTRESSIVNG
jgi:flagellar motor switch protein FliN